MNKRMLVSDLKPRHPPMLHVRMVAVAYMDASPAPQLPFIAVIEVLNAVQIVQVPNRGGTLPVDFERIESFVAARITGRFERRQRAVFKPAQKRASVIDPDGLNLARKTVPAFFDKGLSHGRYFADRAVQP